MPRSSCQTFLISRTSAAAVSSWRNLSNIALPPVLWVCVMAASSLSLWTAWMLTWSVRRCLFTTCAALPIRAFSSPLAFFCRKAVLNTSCKHVVTIIFDWLGYRMLASESSCQPPSSLGNTYFWNKGCTFKKQTISKDTFKWCIQFYWNWHDQLLGIIPRAVATEHYNATSSGQYLEPLAC